MVPPPPQCSGSPRVAGQWQGSGSAEQGRTKQRAGQGRAPHTHTHAYLGRLPASATPPSAPDVPAGGGHPTPVRSSVRPFVRLFHASVCRVCGACAGLPGALHLGQRSAGLRSSHAQASGLSTTAALCSLHCTPCPSPKLCTDPLLGRTSMPASAAAMLRHSCAHYHYDDHQTLDTRSQTQQPHGAA